jgi:peroxiredoxin family protein
MNNKLSIICVSGTLEKLQMAAMVASVAAASGSEVSVFFSMNALQFLVKENSTLVPPKEGAFGDLDRKSVV